MKSWAAAALLAGAAAVNAAHAAADPDILVPYCTAGQMPATGECKPAPGEAYVDDALGANPDVAVGLDPESVPVI